MFVWPRCAHTLDWIVTAFQTKPDQTSKSNACKHLQWKIAEGQFPLLANTNVTKRSRKFKVLCSNWIKTRQQSVCECDKFESDNNGCVESKMLNGRDYHQIKSEFMRCKIKINDYSQLKIPGFHACVAIFFNLWYQNCSNFSSKQA